MSTPADDRETRKLIASLPALRMSPDGQRVAVSTPHVSGTWFVVECFPDDRSDFGYVDSVKVADWVAVAKSAVGEITEAHTRNAVLRSEHRTEVERLRAELTEVRSQNAFLSEMLREAARQGVIVEASEAAAWESSRAMAETADVLSLRLRGMARKVVATRAELHEAVEDWAENDAQVLADSAKLAEENERLRAELVAIGAQRDDAEEERASMVRDLHAAVFDGSTLLPDRPLDTVWEYLLGCVRNDPARLSGGNTPAPSEEQVDWIALFLLRTKVYGTNADPHYEGSAAHQWHRVLTADEREHWRAWARTLMSEAGWGSVVATPADTQAGWYEDLRRHFKKHDGLRGSTLDGALLSVQKVFRIGTYALAPSVGADPEDEVGREAREDAEDTTDPKLIAALRRLGDDFGPLGVALVAARLTDPRVLVDRITDPRGQVQQEPEDPAAAEVVQHRSEFRELPDQPGRWIATCRQGDWIGSGTYDEVENSADAHYDDALTVTSLPAAVADTAHERTDKP